MAETALSEVVQRVVELQGVMMVYDARFRALRRLVLEALEVLKVKFPDGTTLKECLRRIASEEMDVKLEALAEDESPQAEILRKLIVAAKEQD